VVGKHEIRLRSVYIRLVVPSVKRSTVGSRAFLVVGPTTWNSLPENVISALSLSTYEQALPFVNYLLSISFPDIIIDNRQLTHLPLVNHAYSIR